MVTVISVSYTHLFLAAGVGDDAVGALHFTPLHDGDIRRGARAGIQAVSYTHLDVYKRQGYYGGTREKRSIDRSTYYDWKTTWGELKKRQPGAVIFSDVGPGDVYKRQGWERARMQSQRPSPAEWPLRRR